MTISGLELLLWTEHIFSKFVVKDIADKDVDVVQASSDIDFLRQQTIIADATVNTIHFYSISLID